MSEQDRKNINEYHYEIYQEIYNSSTLEQAKAIALEEMRIISEDDFIENDEESTIIELPTNES